MRMLGPRRKQRERGEGDETTTDLAIHEESLARFVSPNMDDFGFCRAVEFGLAWLDDTVFLDAVSFDSQARWMGSRWGRRITVTLTSKPTDQDKFGESCTFRVAIPQLLDESAATSPRRPQGLRVGRFRGTCWAPLGGLGRFRQPLVTYTWTPGTHRITSPVQKGNSYTGLVVGEFGTFWRLRHTTGGRADDERAHFIQVRHRYFGLAPGTQGRFLSESTTDLDDAALDGLVATLCDPKRFTSRSMPVRKEIASLAEWVLSIEKADKTRLHNRAPLKPSDSMALTMDPRNWRATGFGDQLSSAIAFAVGRAARRLIAGEDEQAERARRRTEKSPGPEDSPLAESPDISFGAKAERIRTAIIDAIDDVTCGRDAYSGSVVGERPINSLAHLEGSRQRTFVGFGGLDGYHGRLDLRVLPGGWQDELCPLQTQESAKIGFIRHATLADWHEADPQAAATRYRDLSVAAGLIPFISHDDPTRAALGSKMLKQAVVLENAEPPLVRTGAEALVGEVGTTRSTVSGVVRSIADGIAVIDSAEGPVSVALGREAAYPELTGDAVMTIVGAGSEVAEGDVLGHAPDVQLEGGAPVLSFGCNATVAFLAWEGLNYEDGIVVSESFAGRMRSTHVIRAALPVEPGVQVTELIGASAHNPRSRDEWDEWLIEAGTEIFQLDGMSEPIVMPEDGWLVPTGSSKPNSRYVQRSRPSDYSQEVRFAYRVSRPLQVGDKLTTRHGGKGVVTRVESDDRMPRLVDGPVVEVLLNPLGVIGRLNIGTLMELATGLDAALADGWDAPSPRHVNRRLTGEDRRVLAERLEQRGAPGGRVKFTLERDGEVHLDRRGAMAGPLYLVKLDHLAETKAASRGSDVAPSPVTFQPVKATTWSTEGRRGSPQRLGEMELWSLEAVQAYRTLNDLMARRGTGDPELREEGEDHDLDSLLPAGLRAALAYLAVAGVHFESGATATPRSVTLDPITGERDDYIRAVWRGGAGESGLIDVIEMYRDRAFAEASATTREVEAKDGDGNPIPDGAGIPRRKRGAPSLWAVAERIFDLATGVRGPGSSMPGSDRDEWLRYEIRLPRPVDHPWVELSDDVWFGLPPLHRLAILPASTFRGSADLGRDPLRRKYMQVIRWVLTYQSVEAKTKQAIATSQIDKLVRGLLGVADGTKQDLLTGVARDPSTIAGRLSGKFGLLRRHGLGAAAIYSGRAVLVGDPALDPEDVWIPRKMANDLGLAGLGSDEFERQDDIVLVNRQPTLHPYNLLALRARAWDEAAVGLHPILLKAIAGDFDGDTIAVHRLGSVEARQEIWRLRRPSASLRSGASGRLLAKLDQDVPLGLAIEAGGTSIDVQGLAEASASNALDAPAALGSIADLQRRALNAAQAWRPSVVDLFPAATDEALIDYLAESAPDLHLGVLSGAVDRPGSDKHQLDHWLVGRGNTSLPFIDFPAVELPDSYQDGLADRDYFAAAQPAILGMARKKLLTPLAGTLTRHLVRRAYEVAITRGDCFEAPHDHSVLDCVDPEGPCASAYGTNRETGERVAVGEPVGIRAALFIGETGTQKALKAIHDRSGGNTGAAALAELRTILLPGGGTITIPGAAHAEPLWPELLNQRNPAKPLAVSIYFTGPGPTDRTWRVLNSELAKRVLKFFFPKVATDDDWVTDAPRELKRQVLRLMQEVLVARVRELLPDIDPVHAEVLVRHKYVAVDAPDLALPQPTREPALRSSGLLATEAWHGRVTELIVNHLGEPAGEVLGPNGRRRRAARGEPPDGWSEKDTDRAWGRERLMTTIRNARSGGSHE